MSDFNINDIKSILSRNNGLEIPAKLPDLEGKAGGKDFSAFLKESVEKVNQLQLEANEAINSIAAGESDDIHNTMIAIQKADVSFRMMMEIRKKLVEAYEQVMRMQV